MEARTEWCPVSHLLGTKSGRRPLVTQSGSCHVCAKATKDTSELEEGGHMPSASGRKRRHDHSFPRSAFQCSLAWEGTLQQRMSGAKVDDIVRGSDRSVEKDEGSVPLSS